MLIGIVSDTHDHVDNFKKAVNIFIERGVGYIIHAGDFTSPFTARALKEFQGGFTGIFGNNDGDRLFLRTLFQDRIHPQPYLLTIEGRKIVIVHEPTVVDALADSGHFDLVVYGHTHDPVIKQIKNTMVINPGECGGWLLGKTTAVILDLATMDAELIAL
jgi:hypothetical protein